MSAIATSWLPVKHRNSSRPMWEPKRMPMWQRRLFFEMLSSLGGLGTAHRLLGASEVSSGFTALYERNRLDLTVEALVVQPQFAGLFSDYELEVARQRLRDLGYSPPGAS
jgi:hypothetical protein